MFKRGGSSFQSQGTGITSPYDTPRKNYKIGSWGEWEEKTREATKDPRSDWSYAAQGFGHLGDPYKESGEAKMISEMLHAGAGAVRGSKEKATDLETKGELALLESQAGRMLSDEERAFKAEENRLERESKEKIAADKSTYPDIHPGKLYDDVVGDWKTWVKNNEGRDGHKTVSGNVGAFADADMVVRNEKVKAYDSERTSLAEPVPPHAFKDDGTLNISILSEGVVYYDPISRGWFTVHNIGTENETLTEAETYIDGWHNSQKAFTGTSTTDGTNNTNNNTLKSTGTQKIDLVEKITDDLTEFDFNDKGAILDEAVKLNIIIVEKKPGDAKNWKSQLGEREMTLVDFTEILKRKQFKDKYAHIKGRNTGNISVAQKATGGRVGYAEGDIVDPLDDLKLWWKESIENNEG